MIDSTLRAYQSPTRMAHGVGALRSLGDEARALGMTRPLLVIDGGIVAAGLLDEALTPLRAADLVWDAAESAVAAVYQLTEDVEIPSLRALGFAEEEIAMLAEKAADSQTIGNPRDVDRAGYERIYRRAFETVRKGD